MTGLQRTGRLRPRSRKMRVVYVERAELVADILEARPWCEKRCGRRSVDVHELVSRGRGGSILDESNCVALCRECHDEITQNPAAAEAEGWLLRSEHPKCPDDGQRLTELSAGAGLLCGLCELVWSPEEIAALL